MADDQDINVVIEEGQDSQITVQDNQDIEVTVREEQHINTVLGGEQSIPVTIREGLPINVDMGDCDGGLSEGHFIYNEVPAGVIDSANKLFTTTKAYVTGKLVVLLNGLRELNFIEKSNTTFELDEPPLIDSPTPDKVTTDYIKV